MSEAAGRYHAELAWLGGAQPARDVLIDVRGDTISRVSPDVAAPPDAQRLDGLTVPGLNNTHSHVFHRAIRGHSQHGVADFWSWRTLMYEVADRLTPDSLYQLALATYAEMALSGITAVGEFFYVHHGRDGHPYTDPNELGGTVARAAEHAGIRMTLLDACYLQGGIDGSPLSGAQRRFGDGSWQQWAERMDRLNNTPMLKVGAAIHSVRAVPREAIAPVAEYAASRRLPLHVHVSEQPAENEACWRAYRRSPVELLREEGALGTAVTAVHATHLSDDDIADLGSSGTTVSMCCTTERDLADGVGPAARLLTAGSPIVVGSDAHMMIDLWEEARAVELDERLISGTRGHLRTEQLLTALTRDGAASLGWNAGQIARGALADLTTVRLDSPRTAGARSGDPLSHTLFAATGSDVSSVVVGGRQIVRDGVHLGIPDVGRSLEQAIAAVLQ